MTSELDLWRLAAGLGLFLFGMHQLEQALAALAGRPFKKLLRQYTATPLRSTIIGALSTAALQSSSVVTLIVLAFVGTGIVSLASAIGIVFGSNVGTTVTGWIVATIGFKLDIESLAMPFLAIGGMGIVWSASDSARASISHFVMGLGLLLLGLQFMKSGAEMAGELFDPGALAGYSLVMYVVVGLLVTAVIQSSSAMIMLALSALHAGAISLDAAAAVAIGADLGTMVTGLLGTLAGSAAKKRVIAALVIFNIVANSIAFAFLKPLLYFITGTLGISDPLYALVAFHTLFNTIGVLLFLPATEPLSRRLERAFAEPVPTLTRYLTEADMAVHDVAVENLSRETCRLIDQAVALNQMTFGLPPDATFYDSREDRAGVRVFQRGANYDRSYAELKQLEGEILRHALKLQASPLEPRESQRLSQVIPATRNAVHSAKSMKDVHHDLHNLAESIDDRFNAYRSQFREMTREFYESLTALQTADVANLRFAALVEIKNTGERLHRLMHKRIYAEVTRGELEEVEISTLLNVNRELYISNQSLTMALADALLDMEAARDFAAIPVSG